MQLVKIFKDEDGSPVPITWCYIASFWDSPRRLCDGLCFGYGEGASEYVTMDFEKGGVTCPSCLLIIKKIKEYKC